MIILGIDPGTARTGFGIIEIQKKKIGFKLIKVIDHGCITTFPETPFEKRLLLIFQNLKKIIKQHKPDVLACEEIFFFKNFKTAIKVSQAKGIVLLCASLFKLSYFQYTPLQVKQKITGYGRADKKVVQEAVQKILKLKTILKSDDAIDALAVALCAVEEL